MIGGRHLYSIFTASVVRTKSNGTIKLFRRSGTSLNCWQIGCRKSYRDGL